MRERSTSEPSSTDRFVDEYGDRGPYRIRPSESDPSVLLVERRPAPPPVASYRWRLPLTLFLLTVITTSWVGGFVYSAAVLFVLLCHEMGHFVQARRYGVATSLPFFIPMPLPPLGTMGAVIAMRPNSVGARGLFDIAITGPLAGLVPALACVLVGLPLSENVPVQHTDSYLEIGEPLLFRFLASWIVDVPADHTLLLHPLAFAGWVGFLVTALNLLPVSQLDGGHILYALTPRHAHRISTVIFLAAGAAILVLGLWHWSLLYFLILIFGVRHPPLGVYGERLGPFRRLLGWATLAFLFVGFTPIPLSLPDLPAP
ncbi:MAG: site-2 protease family protein [Thermoanaerobaculia bacterium]|nr:site-2 protease family protein [Thermoanaerobaculia bacterium]